MRKNEPEIEIEMKYSRVLKIQLDGCQKIIAWMYSTHVKMKDTMIDARIIAKKGVECRAIVNLQ